MKTGRLLPASWSRAYTCWTRPHKTVAGSPVRTAHNRFQYNLNQMELLPSASSEFGMKVQIPHRQRVFATRCSVYPTRSDATVCTCLWDLQCDNMNVINESNAGKRRRRRRRRRTRRERARERGKMRRCTKKEDKPGNSKNKKEEKNHYWS